MNSIINMNNVLEKELELERQGQLRRTRRWIGDATKVKDARWYQGSGASQVAEIRRNLGRVGRVVETEPHHEAQRSILARFLDLFRTHREPAYSDC